MNTQTATQNTTANAPEKPLNDKLYRLGLRETRPGIWTWAGDGCAINATIHGGDTDAVVRAAWSDGTFTDVMFFEWNSGDEQRDLLLWLNWYISGKRFTEQGTIGYVNSGRLTN